jgi:broad specificity phosphatase PhoE
MAFEVLMHRLFPASLLALLVLAPAAVPALAAQSQWNRVSSTTVGPAPVVYLVRHAEKLDDSKDPPLSEAGAARAAELARMLAEAGITHVWSTDLKRTRLTAGPVAQRSSVTVATYDPAKLDQLAIRLKTTPGRHLVVGHSNTTPDLVRALGGDPHGAIQDTEYDRLYVMVLVPENPTTVLLRFGPR